MSNPLGGTPRLPDEDTGERLNRLRTIALPVGACIVIAAALAWFLHETRGTGPWAMLGIVLVGTAAGYVVGRTVWFAGDLAGRGFTHVVTASGNLPPAPSFSYQEALIARGRYAEAAATFRDHLAAHPQDHDARIAFGALCTGQLRDPAMAARLYSEVRAGKPTPQQELVVSHALVDLYRATGDRGREMAELARFAARYQGTRAADAAKRALQELRRDAR